MARKDLINSISERYSQTIYDLVGEDSPISVDFLNLLTFVADEEYNEGQADERDANDWELQFIRDEEYSRGYEEGLRNG